MTAATRDNIYHLVLNFFCVYTIDKVSTTLYNVAYSNKIGILLFKMSINSCSVKCYRHYDVSNRYCTSPWNDLLNYDVCDIVQSKIMGNLSHLPLLSVN